MKPVYRNGNVIAFCPVCNSTSTFESKRSGTAEFGSTTMEDPVLRGWPDKLQNYRIVFRLLKCAGCGRAGLAAIDCGGDVINGILIEFLPMSIATLPLPEGVPSDILSEFREAERDASIGSYRSGSAMLRSVLEKVLKAHGYEEGGLQKKVDDAAIDGIITLPLKKRAHETVRVLGNNILHDEWRIVDSDEFEDSHEYTKRILECFYDDPETVKAVLLEKGRVKKVKVENGSSPVEVSSTD